MAIATIMNLNNNVDINTNTNTTTNNNDNDKQQQADGPRVDQDDAHEHDTVMPGFRFHPTEEELVEFYLRRKVEGKPFNIELITYLDLYRYDPWELPALAAIGEKEWFFYVPRDRKYRNGDRPNRVTTSGYWKATGADRMIRGENFRPIGLKKTLVFYSGKAPKGIRTSWIMNEYRLPQHETERYQKAEISLCRVYKRAGVEDHPSVPRGSIPSRLTSSSRATSSSSERRNYHNAFRAQSSSLQQQHQLMLEQQQQQQQQLQMEKISETDASSSTEVGTALGLSHHSSYTAVSPMAASQPPQQQPPTVEVDRMMHFLNSQHTAKQQPQEGGVVGGGLGGRGVISTPTLLPSSSTSLFIGNAPTNHHINPQHQPSMEEFQRLIEYQQAYLNHHLQHQQQQQQQQQQQLQFEALNNNPSSSSTTSAPNSHFLFSNYLFSPSQQPLVNNPTLVVPPTVASSSLQQLPTPATGAGGASSSTGAVAFSDRMWDWNPLPEPSNRDHFSNLFK